jgi:hypothetical protein
VFQQWSETPPIIGLDGGLKRGGAAPLLLLVDFCQGIDYFGNEFLRSFMKFVATGVLSFVFLLGLSSPGKGVFQSEMLSQQRSQLRSMPERVNGSQDWQRECKEIFNAIREGMLQSNMGRFSGYFAPQVRITLPGGAGGYYSASQAFYVLESHFKERKALYVEITSYGDSEANPYASGRIGLSMRGAKEDAQLYTSLSRTGGRWLITEITIY